MVASTHWLASAAGMAILERGGNAFDAAVATGLALQVVEPHLNGPGGEVPVIGFEAGADEPFVVCGQGTAPAAATVSQFRDHGLDLVPGTGLLPACVPGAFGAWMLLLRRYGTVRLADVLEFALSYAERGFPALPRIAETIDTVAPMFREHWPTSADTWLHDGAVPVPGTRMRNPVLAATYGRVLAEAEAASSDRDEQIEAARRVFYEGFVAEAIDQFASGSAVWDVTGERHTGLLRYEDMAAWSASVESPVSYDYRGLTVLKCGPWTQGPVFLQQLALLDGFDVDAMAPVSADLAHLVVECAKLAFADREAFYGDPAFADVPIEALLDDEYNRGRRKLVGPEATTGGLEPGSPGGREPVLPAHHNARVGAAAGLGSSTAGMLGDPTVGPMGQMRGDTCHVDVVDRDGNMVAATPSGGWLHSSPVVPGLGFPLGTRAQMFWLDEGLPNTLAPGKRPRTTLTPSMALREGRPYLAFGTPGGDQQDQWSLLMFLRHVHHGLNLQEAIDAPAWHSAHFPSSFYPREAFPGRMHVEDRLGQAACDRLRSLGHDVVVEDGWSLGRLSAVSRDADGTLRAAANPRGMQGYATGR